MAIGAFNGRGIGMQLLTVNLPTVQADLALDEALLEEAEASASPVELLRIWEPRSPVVVIGSSSRITEEVNQPACARRRIPIARRISGGAAVVTGPGCLMYSLVLSFQLRPELKAIDRAHQFVLGRMVDALRPLAGEVTQRGISDLAVGERKFSGNSLRVKRSHVLYHGTILYDFPVDLISSCLRHPPREPAYRDGRNHGSFVANVPVEGRRLRTSLIDAWHAHKIRTQWPRERASRLAAEKYNQPDWTFRR